MSNEVNLKEESPYGKPWGKCSKHELVRLVLNLATSIDRKNHEIYWRDLFYNGCHQIYRNEYESKQLNKA